MVSTEKTVLDDTLVIFGKNSLSGDIGFLGKRSVNTYSGLVRDQDTSTFILVESITLATDTNNIDANDSSLVKASLELDSIVADSGTIDNTATQDNDIANKAYVDQQVANVGIVADNTFIVPVGNTQSRPTNPADGTLRFNTDTNTFEGYHGSTYGWDSFVPAEVYLDTSTGRPNPAVQGQIWYNPTNFVFEGYHGPQIGWKAFIPSTPTNY